ncbi:MAG: M20 family metallopeptidase [Burkholderiaceae bacterium]
MTLEQRALELARELIAIDSSNSGAEDGCARLLGALLAEAGFRVRYYELAPGRTGLVAELGRASRADAPARGGKPLCFTGHLDTVPFGQAPWSVPPLSAAVRDGKLYGRGACDMKAGVAALTISAIANAALLRETAGVMLVLTAGEETGCQGAADMIRRGLDMRRAGAIVVAEPTANEPLLGHKGALWLKLSTGGVGAHGSMPERGENALLKGAYLATRLAQFRFETAVHQQLGLPSLNVGTFHSGSSVNMVPDHAEVGVDIRTTPGMAHDEVVDELSRHLAPADYSMQRVLDLPGVWTDPAQPWISAVLARLAQRRGRPVPLRGASYFTDCCVLGPASGDAPILILGPGDPKMAHQTDEYCEIAQIDEALAIYDELLRSWCLDETPSAAVQPEGAST